MWSKQAFGVAPNDDAYIAVCSKCKDYERIHLPKERKLGVLSAIKLDNVGSRSHNAVSTRDDDVLLSQCRAENCMFQPSFTHYTTSFPKQKRK
jgi:hypothetical protein